MDEKANRINNRLYWTNYNISALYDECVDPETGEVSPEFPGRLAALLQRDDANKDDAINEIKSRVAMIAARKAEIARLQDENRRDTSAVDTLKQTLGDVLGGEKYAGVVGSVSYRRSRAVEIGDADALTVWAQTNGVDIFTHPAPVISKTAVGDLLGDGVEIPHAEIVERVSVIVK